MNKKLQTISIIMGFFLGVFLCMTFTEVSVFNKILLSLLAQFACYGFFSVVADMIKFFKDEL